MIGGRYSVRLSSSPRPRGRFASYKDACAKADRIGGEVIDMTEDHGVGEVVVYESLKSRQQWQGSRR